MTNLLGWVRQGFSAQETLSFILKTEEELDGFVPGVTQRVGRSPLPRLSSSHAGQEAAPSRIKTQGSWILP